MENVRLRIYRRGLPGTAGKDVPAGTMAVGLAAFVIRVDAGDMIRPPPADLSDYVFGGLDLAILLRIVSTVCPAAFLSWRRTALESALSTSLK